MAELFTDFEVNKTPRWQKLLRLTGASFVLHVLFFLAIIYVPILREAFNVADRFSSAEYVDEEYEKTRIADRAVMIDVSRGFQYPPGYFNTNPTEAPPEIIPQPTPVPTPVPTPTPTPTPEPSPSPQSSPTPADADKTGTVADGKQPQTKEEAEKALDDMAAKNGVVRPHEDKINKKPLKDWLASANEKYRNSQLDLNNTIEIVIVAQRDEKGKLTNPQVVRKTGDPNLIEVAKDLVSAINDSNIFYFLEGSGGGEVRFIVKLDASQVTASVESEVESEARALTMARTYGSMLLVGRIARSDKKDEAVIYQNTRISARGKQVVVNFTMPRQAAGDMLKKQIPAT